MVRRLSALVCLIGCMALPASASALELEPTPFASAGTVGGPAGGLKCMTVAESGYEGGVRFCPGSGKKTRIPTWDGVPLDVDVTLPPASIKGPYPTILMLHGYGGNKADFESKTPQGSGSVTFDYNNDYYAQQGYAVVNYTVRGFGKSCGGEPGGRPSNETVLESPPACVAHGFIHLGDQRYEARDAQYLLGLLVDEGIAKPGALGTTGISYGGGQSVELAYLKNRIRCPGPEDPYAGLGTDPCQGAAADAFVPWTSPGGKTLEINAAYPRWPWSDLISALIPNGRFLDYDNRTAGQDGATGTESPIGVPIQSYIAGLYSLGSLTGYYEQPGGNPEFNLTKNFALINSGEPSSPEAQEAVNKTAAHDGGFVLGGAPAPLLIENGWNDDLFPPLQALRVYNSVQGQPGADVALQFGDIGHSRGSNKPRVDQYFNAQGAAFFAEHLQGKKSTVETAETGEKVGAPAPNNVSTFTTTCPSSGATAAPDGGPYNAISYPTLKKGEVVLSSGTEQTVTEPGGNPNLGTAFDPIANSNGCKTVKAEEPAGTANYKEPVKGAGFTLLGLPTVVAKIQATGTANGDGQLDARLWDVMPNGEELLVSRGGYRLEEPQTPQVVFQLHGNGYKFPAGDTVKLELTSNDAPYYRKANGPFTIAVKSATIVLPTLEGPAGQVSPPEAVPLPLPEAPLHGFPPPVMPGAGPTPGSAPATPPSATGTTASAPAKATSKKKASAKCASRRGTRIRLPHYARSRITRVALFVNGKRAHVTRGRSLRSVPVSFEGRAGNSMSVRLRLRVRKGGHTSTRNVTHRFQVCR